MKPLFISLLILLSLCGCAYGEPRIRYIGEPEVRSFEGIDEKIRIIQHHYYRWKSKSAPEKYDECTRCGLWNKHDSMSYMPKEGWVCDAHFQTH